MRASALNPAPPEDAEQCIEDERWKSVQLNTARAANPGEKKRNTRTQR